jgi:hypothetical protein
MRVGAVVAGIMTGFGGPGAMATGFLVDDFSFVVLVGVVAEVAVPVDPVVDFGDSDSVVLAFAGVLATWATEFLRLAAFLDRDETPGTVVPLPLLRFLITSVLRLRGLTTPCSLRNRPHALQSGCPSGLRRQSGVVCVKQLVHVVSQILVEMREKSGS